MARIHHVDPEQMKALLGSGLYRHATLYDYDRPKPIYRLNRAGPTIAVTPKEPTR